MSGLPWLRLYSNIVDNGKIRLLAYEDRWHFIAILCIKQQGILKSNKRIIERTIAVKLGVQLRELDEIKRRLVDVDLIDHHWNPIGWDEHQFKSDSNAERMRKSREKKKQTVTVTSPLRNSDVLDTDTDTDTDTEKTKTRRFAPPSVSDVAAYCSERSNQVDATELVDHYEANGWMRGKAKIKDWKACVRTWEKNKSNGSAPVYGAYGI